MQARLRRREVFVHCSWINSIDLMGKAPSFVFIVRRCRGLAVMTTSSVIPRARTMGAPKPKNVCQSSGFATIIANRGTTIERPIKRPAMKLPACRNLAGGFFMTHSDPDCDGRGCPLRCEMQRVPEILQFPVIVERRRSPALEPQPF